MKDLNILFSSIVPEYFGGIYLALIELKSYLLDKDATFKINHTRNFVETPTKEVVKDILKDEPDVVGFSVYIWNIDKIFDICRELKKQKENIIIIIGGSIPTYQAKEILEACPGIDFSVLGEGEEVLYSLLMNLRSGTPALPEIPNIIYREEENIVENPMRIDCSNIANHSYQLLVDEFKDLEIVYFETARGCFFKCKYCAYRLNYQGRNILKYYPLEKVLKDLDNIFELEKVKELIIFDTNIIYSKHKSHRDRGLTIIRHINDLNKKRTEKGLGQIQVEIDTQPDELDDESILELKRLNCHAYSFGLQSINKNVLRLANRRFNKEKFIENIEKIKEKCGAPVYIEIIFGLPGDSLELFKETLEFVLTDVSPFFIYCYRFKLLPGSLFWDEKEKYNIKYNTMPPYNVLSTDTYSEEDFRKTEQIASFIRMVYLIFRNIKNRIDKTFTSGKLDLYLTMMDFMFKEYSDLLNPETITEENVYTVIKELKKASSSEIRFKMKSDMQKIIKDVIAQRSLAECS